MPDKPEPDDSMKSGAEPGLEPAPNGQPDGPKERRRRWGFWLCLFVVVWWWSGRSPLPSDEEMIAHLEAHRPAFEELVRRHRTFYERVEQLPKGTTYRDEAGYKELLQETGIERITNVSAWWPPDPYNPDSDRRLDEEMKQCWAEREAYRLARGLKRDQVPMLKCDWKFYAYKEWHFIPKASKYKQVSFRYSFINKSYCHFPEAPKIKGSFLLGPIQKDSRAGYNTRAVASLNRFPLNWKRGSCVYRRIDEHWFLRMCRGA